MTNENRIAVARVGKLFGEARSGGVTLTLYEQFDDEFDFATEPLFVEITRWMFLCGARVSSVVDSVVQRYTLPISILHVVPRSCWARSCTS